MVWTSPHTLTTSDFFTSTDWNTYVRDNLNQTMPGLAASPLQYFVSSAAHTLVARAASHTTTAGAQTTTSGSYVGLLTATAVTITTGTQALVMWSAGHQNSVSSNGTFSSVAVSGATTLSSSDTWCATVDGVTSANTNRLGMAHLFTLTAGSNTFTMQYKVQTAGNTGTFSDRTIIVVPL